VIKIIPLGEGGIRGIEKGLCMKNTYPCLTVGKERSRVERFLL